MWNNRAAFRQLGRSRNHDRTGERLGQAATGLGSKRQTRDYYYAAEKVEVMPNNDGGAGIEYSLLLPKQKPPGHMQFAMISYKSVHEI